MSKSQHKKKMNNNDLLSTAVIKADFPTLAEPQRKEKEKATITNGKIPMSLTYES